MDTQFKTVTLPFYSDPGHGWVKVSNKFLERYGISYIKDRITFYSYKRNDNLYLEEDVDLSTLVTALWLKGIGIQYKNFHTNKNSKIRGYKRYMENV